MIDFGKHAFFIWASYGVAGFGLIAIAWSSYARMRALEAAAKDLRRARGA
jgi:heme exporter protein CcmD